MTGEPGTGEHEAVTSVHEFGNCGRRSMTDRSILGKAVGVGAIVLTLLLASTPASANMIANGGFETGDFDDWLPIPPPVDSLFFVNGSPHTGLYAAWFGTFVSGGETLSQ